MKAGITTCTRRKNRWPSDKNIKGEEKRKKRKEKNGSERKRIVELENYSHIPGAAMLILEITTLVIAFFAAAYKYNSVIYHAS